MDKKEHQTKTVSSDLDNEKKSNNYKFLFQKLKSIKANIKLLERNFLQKEI